MDKLKLATDEREHRMQRDREIRIFVASIEKQPTVLETWDDELWICLLETATVYADSRIVFRFKNGTEISI